ncbi:MAG: Mrp/NBP35 family ATP-binding protein [Coriobacteriaceae bacterium]
MPLSKEEQDQIKQEMDTAMHGDRQQQSPLFPLNEHSHIKHVIGVMSGKGGVGKSLVTGILATQLSRHNAKVGIMDADITGPSIPKMFGLDDMLAGAKDNNLVPVTTKGGIKVMSTNLILQHNDDPVLWRGPILAGALRQFWGQCDWGDIDFLLVDMPPGTGDVALTVFQSLPIEGVIIVSSPQDLVQMVVGKAVRMAKMMKIAVLGLVENMAYIECPHCGEKIEPFGPSRAKETANHYDMDFLGQLPINPDFSEMCDEGTIEEKLPRNLLPDGIAAILTSAELMGER